MKPVGILLSSLFKSLGIEDRIKLSDLQNSWHILLNEPLTLHTYPTDLKDGELVINVDSPTWIGELKFFKNEIIQRLRTYNIKDIRFRLGVVYQKKGVAKEVKRDGERVHMKRSISDSDLAWIEQTLANISDIALKEQVRKAILVQIKTQRVKK